jgi:hypothetical protein
MLSLTPREPHVIPEGRVTAGIDAHLEALQLGG